MTEPDYCPRCRYNHAADVTCMDATAERVAERSAQIHADIAAITADRCHHGTPRRFCVEHREVQDDENRTLVRRRSDDAQPEGPVFIPDSTASEAAS